LKPAVGKQIIADSLIQAAASGSFNPCFDTERFIFGKIREYTLRAASHGNKVHVVSAVSVHDENHSNEDIHESLQFRIAAQVVLDSSHSVLKSIPRILQTHVAAQILKSMAAMTSASAASSWNQCSSLDERRTSSAGECAQSSFLFALSLLISRAMNSVHNNACGSQSNHVKSTAARSSLSIGASAPWLGLRKESGFGTSPIWYQQSMATGPPPQASRWNIQK